MASTPEVDVAIVGAGLAGLAAATAVAKAGRSVLVLEARDRVGGRVHNQDIGDGRVVEMGGQWLGPGQDQMYLLAKDLGVETFPTHDDGDVLAWIGRKRYRFKGDLPLMNPLVIADLVQAVAALERQAKRVPLDKPWEAKRARAWDSQTTETWLRRRVRTDRARELLHLYLSAVFAAEPANLSMLHTLFYIHSGEGFDNLIRFRGGAQQDRIVGGSQTIALLLADRLGDVVFLESPIRRIEQTPSKVVVHSDALSVEAQRAIVAIPPTLAGRITYDPPLPPGRDQLTQRVPQGSVVKVNAVYESPFWRNEGLRGQAADPSALVGFTADNSPPDGDVGVLVGFIEGRHAQNYSREDPSNRRKLVLDDLARYFGPQAATPLEYHERDWSAEEWTRGCYGGHFAPGVWSQYGHALRESIGRIHWAGTETSSEWNGYMEGAVRSGQRAASEVLSEIAG
ncbi:MAG TPA: FAD-dependent oxidoreductase [Actinomycetota bacterium]|nr:FAD-dependent oxidoreductase [Actinomycetota bacterium]